MLDRVRLLFKLLVFLESRRQDLLSCASFLLTVQLADFLLGTSSEVSDIAIKVRVDTFFALL